MGRGSKTRRVLKRAGTAYCVAVFSTAVITIWVRPVFGFGYGYVAARHGNLAVVWSAADDALRGTRFSTGLNFAAPPARFQLLLPTIRQVRPRTSVSPPRVDWFILLPFWLLLAVGVVPTARLWLRNGPYPRGCCHKCGYNLTGNVSGVCPECGTAHRRNETASGTT
jgi:hypothetical protein